MQRPRVSASAAPAVLACALAFFATACPIDERLLLPAPDEEEEDGGEPGQNGGTDGGGDGGSGGDGADAGAGGDSGMGGAAGVMAGGNSGTTAGSGGGGTSGSGGVAGGGGTSGSGGVAGGGTGGTNVAGQGGCAEDIDGNGIADCTETILLNPHFDSNNLSWIPEVEVVASAWDAANASVAPNSGSLAVMNTNHADVLGQVGRSANQCVAVTGNTQYEIHGHIYVATAEGENVVGQIGGRLFDSADCTGPFTNFDGPYSMQNDAWQLVAATFTTLATTQSMLVRLVTIKPFVDTSATAKFDNVLLKPQ